MDAVAVGGLHNGKIRTFHGLGIDEDGLIRVADIAGEHRLSLNAVFAQPNFDGCGAEKMSDVGKAQGDGVVYEYFFTVAAGTQAAQKPLNVLQIVKRCYGRLTSALGFAGLPLGVAHLNVRTVTKHDVQKRAGGGGGVDRTLEAVFVKQRQSAGVVNVGVGDDDEVKQRRGDGKLLVFKQVLSLLHAVVHKTLLVADLDQGAGAGDLMRCA